ncbi:MAG: glycoside hydrolase [Bryobacteraceae bacterium]|nr:glycoside hydrolase [Bryobacteraceae bacterium]MDW8378669.1 sialidase family protein [Bryobacterales bacterium]
MRWWIGPLFALAALSEQPQHIAVFRSGEGGYHTYRIPAIVRTQTGVLLAFCEGRRNSRADTGDIDLLLKRSQDGGRSWSQPIIVADFGTDTVGNPAPVVDRKTGVIWLLLTRNPGQDTEQQILNRTSSGTRTVWVTYSKDGGLSWAKPQEITPAVKKPGWTWYATGPGNGIQLRSGRIVIACDHNRGGVEERYSHVIYSDDHGASWKLGGSVGPKCNESTVAELPDGGLVLNMRSYHGKNRRAVSYSRDGGLNWTEPVLDETLIEPVCQASLIRWGKRELLFSNPASTKRENMVVRLSRDGGKTWMFSKTVYPGPAAYSNLVELAGGWVGLLYERGTESPYEEIRFARFPISWLKAQTASPK